MTSTWDTAWETLESKTPFRKRDGQQTLGRAVFSNVFDGGQLIAEGPTGVGKSLTALIPAISAVKEKKQRTILTTETLSLLDQIVDKDLPTLYGVYGGFTFFGLKGRSHYLCVGKAGSNHPVVLKVRSRLEGTNGERRDVEKILGYRMDDEDWSEICGETEFCAHNKCQADNCYSASAREKAASADIVITSHTMLQIHGEFIQNGMEGGLLGDFAHIVVDEAHSLEKIVVDGSTLEIAPWELHQKTSSISKGVEALGGVASSKEYSDVAILSEILEKKMRDCLEIVQNIFEFQVGQKMPLDQWQRQSMLLGLIYITGASAPHSMALELYEETLPQLSNEVAQGYSDLAKKMKVISKDMPSGKAKVNKAITAAGYIASIYGMIANTVSSPSGTVDAYGSTYALFVDGCKGRSATGADIPAIRIRAVPLDISQFLKRNLWKPSRSVTIISATLRDQTDGSFRFLRRSLGLDSGCKELVVDSPFSFQDQQLVFLTDGKRQDIADVPGARFSIGELKNLIEATDGRSLILFTAMSELQYVADELRNDPSFKYTLLVQEKGADKSVLAERFKNDINSVLLASKSYFQGFDVPGESLTSLIMCKFSLPQYNATTKSAIRYWRESGFPQWYEMKSIETFVQAFGRLIRSADCRGVVALLDERVSRDDESISRTVRSVIPKVYGNVEITSDTKRVRDWLNKETHG